MSRASTEESSNRSSPVVSSDERRFSPHLQASGGGGEQAPFVMHDEDDVLKQTTGVVKTVKDLSDKIHKCKPSDYIDLVKVRHFRRFSSTPAVVAQVHVIAWAKY